MVAASVAVVVPPIQAAADRLAAVVENFSFPSMKN
jgi:hypothetical protein